jgi:hypothetical protein
MWLLGIPFDLMKRHSRSRPSPLSAPHTHSLATVSQRMHFKYLRSTAGLQVTAVHYPLPLLHGLDLLRVLGRVHVAVELLHVTEAQRASLARHGNRRRGCGCKLCGGCLALRMDSSRTEFVTSGGGPRIDPHHAHEPFSLTEWKTERWSHRRDADLLVAGTCRPRRCSSVHQCGRRRFAAERRRVRALCLVAVVDAGVE